MGVIIRPVKAEKRASWEGKITSAEQVLDFRVCLAAYGEENKMIAHRSVVEVFAS